MAPSRPALAAALCLALSSAALAQAPTRSGQPAAPPTEMDSRKQIISFMEEWATMNGAVSACSPDEAELVRQCAMLILNKWDLVTGMPAPTDRDFQIKVSRSWEFFSANAAKKQSEGRTETCEHVVALSRASKIWEICQRPVAAARQEPARQPDPSEAIKLQ